MYEDEGRWCRLKIALGLTCWTGLKKQRQQKISLIIFVSILGVPKITGPLWTWEDVLIRKQLSAHGDPPLYLFFSDVLKYVVCVCYSDTWTLSFSVRVLAALG